MLLFGSATLPLVLTDHVAAPHWSAKSKQCDLSEFMAELRVLEAHLAAAARVQHRLRSLLFLWLEMCMAFYDRTGRWGLGASNPLPNVFDRRCVQ